MLARAVTHALVGLEPRRVDVEVHIETTHELGCAYEVNVPLAGEMDCWVGGRHTVGTPNRAVVNGPTCTSTLHGFGLGKPLFGLKVGRDALEAQYHLLHGHPADRTLELSPYVELDTIRRRSSRSCSTPRPRSPRP